MSTYILIIHYGTDAISPVFGPEGLSTLNYWLPIDNFSSHCDRSPTFSTCKRFTAAHGADPNGKPSSEWMKSADLSPLSRTAAAVVSLSRQDSKPPLHNQTVTITFYSSTQFSKIWMYNEILHLCCCDQTWTFRVSDFQPGPETRIFYCLHNTEWLAEPSDVACSVKIKWDWVKMTDIFMHNVSVKRTSVGYSFKESCQTVYPALRPHSVHHIQASGSSLCHYIFCYWY